MVFGHDVEAGCGGVNSLLRIAAQAFAKVTFCSRSLLICFAFVMSLFIHPSAFAASSRGKILREARCKVLIQGPLAASEGEELSIRSKSRATGSSEARVQILKNTGKRLVGRVIGTSDCRRFRGMFVTSSKSASTSGRRVARRKGPPPLVKLIFGGGPGLSNATFTGISREAIVEDYPLVLTTLDLGLESYPFAFMAGKSLWQSVLGIDLGFRYVTSLSNVQAITANPVSGDEIELEMSFKRLFFRTGIVARLELWKQRLFADARLGYYFSRTTSTLEKLVNAPADSAVPIEISPLRDLGLTGVYVLGGVQFQPSASFRARIDGGVVLAPNYQIDNRLGDAPRDAEPVAEPIDTPSAFLLESTFGYLIGKLHLGLQVSLEKFSGEARFPGGASGFVSEQYLNYGLNVSYLL